MLSNPITDKSKPPASGSTPPTCGGEFSNPITDRSSSAINLVH